MGKNTLKKLDVHFVQHTHWDREWYFTSDDSRTMLYYDMRSLIGYLEKNEDVFTFDGQSSVIDDFLKFSSEYKDRMDALIESRKLLVGPFYTQTDDVLAAGESIVRNLEIGIATAESHGHAMKVGYLPDVFGHNNQIAQILKMNGIESFSFYRGLDPKLTDNQLYFWYESPDGTKVLGHWQTHYSTHSKAFEYTNEAFEKYIVEDYIKPGQFDPSVKSYAKRNLGLPIGIPIGTDQKPVRKEVKEIIKNLNSEYAEFNFIVSDYESLLKDVAKEIKSKKKSLHTVTGELRAALTGRVHRSILASRMDVKQLIFELETQLIDVLEPMSILCLSNDIDVPWAMIEYCWKELFKSSAHDSYGSTNEDHVNNKIIARTTAAIRICKGVSAMLGRIYASRLVNEKEDAYKKLLVFNFKPYLYEGIYRIELTVKKGYEDGKFKIFQNGKEIKYAILKRNNIGTHERDALEIVLSNVKIEPFGHALLNVEYFEVNEYNDLHKSNFISSQKLSLKVDGDDLVMTLHGKEYKNFLSVFLDPSVGDTYDHSPITFNDKKYRLANYELVETSLSNNVMRVRASALVPSGIDKWKSNEPSITQDVDLTFTIIDDNLFIKIIAINKSLNGRMILAIETMSTSDKWYHDQQFGIYNREIVNGYMANWEKPDYLGYKWDEYPTNLSAHQWFISNNEANLTIFTQNTKEHEMIDWEGKKYFAITIYRAVDKFGRAKMLYRPGRSSGANTDAPEAQLLNKHIECTFLLSFGNTSVAKQFKKADQLKGKNFYMPGQWALERTLLRWETDINYFDKDKNNRRGKLFIPEYGPSFQLTSLYKDAKGRVLGRYLNLGAKKIINSELKISRTLSNFKVQSIEVPKFGLFNVLIEKE